MTTDQDANLKLSELVSGFSIAMLVTHSPDDDIRARPMAIAAHDESNGVMVFATSAETGKIDEIRADETVAVVLQGDGRRYVSLSGTGTVRNDRQAIRKHFNPAWKVWFPEGPEQADIRLIEFRPDTGEYWDNSGKEGLAFLMRAGKALVTGEQIEPDEAQHGKVEFS